MATAKGEHRRAALVRAAAELLQGGGLEAVGHRAVAGRAGVPLGATTYYFADLTELRRAAVDALADDDIARMSAAVDALPARRRGAAAVARMIATLLTPDEYGALVAWYERYVLAAREPLFAAAARRTNAAARASVAAVLDRSGLATDVPPQVVLAVVDGAVLGALADGAGLTGVRAAAADALATVLDRP
ncbi:TetR/AcrR family transcriptional regulator [Jiangella rhizosphaerae]|uniref:TetR family transcriptional regulator n=1 Tax=Jiangella rhizosphaerae TaxID=2293569 RepID=A0A418KVB0_9ACTN|nr:TetR family transcriptional regulator [Jiangella rhizosphaerae]RIQ34173.1 TetR family transcriptional regulator [Jiangella rhizosphaerae]